MCMTPLIVRDKITQELKTPPCGKCPECTARRISAWSFRLMQEDKVSISSQFITLTYDTTHIPITSTGYKSLRKRDVQLFFKRLRKNPKNNGRKIKYYLAAEYGAKTWRPHYHIILFNADITTIQPAWAQGEIHYGTISEASVGYTLKYISKAKRVPQHRNDNRQPEFSLMSKGLGLSYLTDKIKRYHKADLYNRICVNLEGGKKASMPRYYKDKIYTEVERKQIAAKFKKEYEVKNLAWINQSDYSQKEHEKAQRVKAAFDKQKFNSSKNEKL